MITLRNITLAYGDRTLVQNGSAEFAAGELTALIGRNGAGKSTLLRAITAIEPPKSGEVLLDGTNAAAMPPETIARTISFVGTEKVRIANLRCEDIVAIGRAPYTNWIGRMQAADRRIVADALQAVGMEAFAARSIDTLSDGECQRIMIARALAQQTPTIVLDEPSAFLDIPTRFEICRLLQRLAHDEGKCILFSTHDLDAAMPVCDSVAVISDRTITKLPAAEIRRQGIIERLFVNR
ncbi:MAG: ABC transporter ATP-binding protein [Alistipes sp.]|nr:ABC transporter ATP-binding protein [Alistipes sp.]